MSSNTVCGRPGFIDYSQYPYVTSSANAFSSPFFGDKNYGLISFDQYDCNDFNSAPYTQPLIPNGSKVVNSRGLYPNWYEGPAGICSDMGQSPMNCAFEASQNQQEKCNYPYIPMGCGFTWNYSQYGPGNQALMCSSDWSGVSNNIVQCCAGMISSSDECQPDWCPASTSCTQALQTACTPTNWGSTLNAECTQYANLSGPTIAQPLILGAVKQFYATNSPTANDPFVGISIDMCSKYPGLCDSVLTSACSGFQLSDLNPSQWSGRTYDPDGTNLMKVCGCFLPSSQYAFPPGVQGPEGIACNSTCSFPGTIPVFNSQTNSVAQCKATVCAVSDVTVDVSASTVGAINLSQVCGQCSSSDPCICYFNDIQVNDINDPTLQVQISSNCQTCFNYDSKTGISTQVACPGGGGTGGFISNIKQFVGNNRKTVYIVGFLMLLLIGIGMFWLSVR